MLSRYTVAALALALSVALPVSAAPDGAVIVKQGNGSGTPACATCHGENGVGQASANFVRLAGLGQAYLAKQLRDFESGARENPVMKPIASALKNAEKAAVARYYAALPRPRVPAEPADDQTLARGEALARQGGWDRELPACFQCHGENGRGVPPNFPAIAGQSASYAVLQMNAWRAGARRNDPVGLMTAVAAKLSDDDIKAVAAYLAGNAVADAARSARQ